MPMPGAPVLPTALRWSLPSSRVLLLVGLLACAVSSAAQEIRTMSAVTLREAEQREGLREFYSTWPNLDVNAIYFDRRLLADIEAAEAENDIPRLERLLTAYVRNFAVGNFRQDRNLNMVWRLAQIAEQRRDTAKALYYYGIALRNQSKALPKVQMAFDTLRSPTRTRFVDLDYYYQLVATRRVIDTLVPPKGVLINMGDRINSPAPDYAPYMHPSNNLLLFTSRRALEEEFAPSNRPKEDLFFSQVNPFGEGWEPAQRFGDIINSPFNEGSACLNFEATELYFTRCDAPDGLGVCDLYVAEFKQGKWVNVRNLGPNVNSSSWDSHPHISRDGKWLYFASNRSGGFGRTDLYRSARSESGAWGPAVNLGPMINTIENEVTPFLHPINQTLYFSSQGHLNNVGGFDIFKARWKLNHWTEPVNLGPLVNSRGDEYYFSIDGKGELLFYAAARRETPENLDLYSFPMPMNARPDAVVKLKGYLIDSLSGQPITGVVAAFDQEKGTEIAPIYTSRTGYFEFDLIGNRRYLIVVLGTNAVTIKEDVPVKEDTLLRIFSRGLELGRPIVFETLKFQKNSAEIERPNIPRLKVLGDFLKRYPKVRLTIRGHTDADGVADENLQLSQERAENIRQMLLSASGQPDSLIRAEGYGESRPIFPNDSPEHKAVNRRVEFELTIPLDYKDRLGTETIVFDDRTGARIEERVTDDALEEEEEAAAEEADPLADEMAEDLGEEDLDDLSGLLGEMLDEMDDEAVGLKRDSTAADTVRLGKDGKPLPKAPAKPGEKPDPKKPDPKKPTPAKPETKPDPEEEEEDDEDELDDDGSAPR